MRLVTFGGAVMILARSSTAFRSLRVPLDPHSPKTRGIISQKAHSSSESGTANHPLVAEVSKLADEIRAMKATGMACKDEVMTKVASLNALKVELAVATGQPPPVRSLSKREKAEAARKSKFALEGGRVPPPQSSFPKGAYDKRDFFHYETVHTSTKSGARVGRIHTPHGVIDTPGFVAVATNGAVKALDIKDAVGAGQQLIFSNSYHLMLQPGGDIIEAAGGLHKFMRYDGPLITDSGGFQIFSLANQGGVHGDVGEIARSKDDAEPLPRVPGGELKRAVARKKTDSGEGVVSVTEEGVVFRSYRDGTYVTLTPESTVQAQKQYGSDIIIPLDELPPFHTTPERLLESVLLSHRWEERSLREHLKNVKNQAMYAVIHGGIDKDLRQLSSDFLTQLPFDGYAIGGSLGSCHEELVELVAFLVPKLPKDKPNHLLGIADERSILAAVPLGIDTFDSCFPTRLARHGTLLTKAGKLHVSNQKCATAFGEPICRSCACSTCASYDLAYLHHLKKAKEPLLWQLASIHNIHYMNDLMAGLRQQILANEI